MSLNPWASRFARRWTDDEIDAVIYVAACPPDICRLSADAGAEILRDAFQRIFVSSGQTRKVLRQLIDIALAHARSHFVSAEVYEHGLYQPKAWGEACAPAVCFTGLAGDGKSALLVALEKLLGTPTSTNIPGLKGIPLVAGWFLTLRDGAGLNQLLRPYTMPVDAQNPSEDDLASRSTKDIKIPELFNLARRRSWRDGVCLLGIDEFQFVTLGTAANAKATSLLLQFQGVGPRLIYVANFSLVHRLKRRGHEDRARLLQCPIILQPEVRSSPDWKRLLEEFKKVAPEVFTFDVDATEELIHQYTFGIKRSVVALLVAAFRETHNRGSRHSVGANEISRAYKSAEFTIHREEVEILWRQSMSGRVERQDLWCPFSDQENAGNISIAQQAIEDYQRRVDDDYMRSSLTPAENAGLQSIEPKRPRGKPSGQLVRMPRQKITKESLLEGSKRIADLDR